MCRSFTAIHKRDKETRLYHERCGIINNKERSGVLQCEMERKAITMNGQHIIVHDVVVCVCAETRCPYCQQHRLVSCAYVRASGSS
jgi:hypothetical protein